MTNTPTDAGADLGVPGTQPATPDTPPMSAAEATSRKDELINDSEFRNLLMSGDVAASAEWRRVVDAVSRPPEMPTAPREAAAEHLNASAGYSLSPDVLQEFVENRPVSPLERHFAQAKFDELKQDREWFARWSRGEQKARKELALIQSILSRPIRDPQPQS